MMRIPVLARPLFRLIADYWGITDGVYLKNIFILILVLVIIVSYLLFVFEKKLTVLCIIIWMLSIPALLFMLYAERENVNRLIRQTLRVLSGRNRARVVPFNNPIPDTDERTSIFSLEQQPRCELANEFGEVEDSSFDEIVVVPPQVENPSVRSAQGRIETSSDSRRSPYFLRDSPMRRNVLRNPEGHETPPIPGAISGPLEFGSGRQTRRVGDKKSKPDQKRY